jgi:hypothetical protein
MGEKSKNSDGIATKEMIVKLKRECFWEEAQRFVFN